ncbi:hypothetical protein LCM08_06110 [Salipiger pacificus]|nr:hypothetical protein [Alloyangia pacifica]
MGRWYRQGTVDLVQGSASVAGTGTIWDTQAQVGDPFRADSHPDHWIEIDAIAADGALTLAEPWPYASETGAGYAIVRNFANTPNADLAANVAGLISKYSDLNVALGNWLTGTATGGPNGDGYYPVTIAGEEHLIPCPALIDPPATPEERVARGIYNRVTHSPAGDNVTLDLGQGSVFRLVLNAASCLLVMSNKPTEAGTAFHATVVLEQGTGGNLIDWSQIANLKWNGGVLPVLSSAQGAVDVVDLMTLDGGNSWFGFYSGQGIV